MKNVTINKNRILFGAMVMALGLSQSWLSPREYSTFASPSFALGSQSLASSHCNFTQCEPDAPATPSPVVVPAVVPPAPSTATPPTAKPVDVYKSEYKSTSKDGKVNKIKVVTKNIIKPGEVRFIVQDGHMVKDNSAAANKAIEATFVVNDSCTDCVKTLTLENVQSIEEMNLKIQEHINTSLTEKDKKEQEEKLAAEKKEKEAKALKLAIEKCDKAEVDGEIVDLKKSKNRKQRIECLAAKVDADDDHDKDAFRKLRSAINKEIMAHSSSEDPAQRQEAIDMLDDLGTKYSDNRNLEKYLTTMKKGAEDFNEITEISQAAANDPAVRAQSVYHIDYLAGKWNPARTNGMSEGVRLGVTDWHNPMLALARQAQKDPKVIANQYFGTGDLELDSPIGLDESQSTGTGIGSARGNRKSIGLESRPIYRNNAGSALNPRSSLGQRRGSALSTNRGFADDQRMFENDMGYDFDRFDSRFNNGRNNNRYGNSRYGNPRNNPRYNNRNGFNNRNNQFDRFNSPGFRR